MLGRKVLAGCEITYEEALALTKVDESEVPLLCGFAHKIRDVFMGDTIDLCAIVNGRSGRCSEDCKFCAQSAHHDTKIDIYPLLDEEQLLAAARKMENEGANRFSIVTSGRGTERDSEFPLIVKAIKRINDETGLKTCVSLGTVSAEHALVLKEAGVSRYHHNLETAASFYAQICSTHGYEERLDTIRHCKQAGLEVCVGGIFGLGETAAQRVEFAFTLKDIGVDSVPINILNPIPGTPLENAERLSVLEILKAVAIYRFILPKVNIRFCGGREVNLGEFQAMGLLAGANGLMIGNYLTTAGRDAAMDRQMVRAAGLKLAPSGDKDGFIV
jgi:biotin synthase